MPDTLHITIVWHDHTYPIIYTEATGASIRAVMERIGVASRRIAVITDSNVYALEKTQRLLRELGLDRESVLVFEAGESSKNRTTMNVLQDQLLARRYGRDSLVIALGGGVTGDMAGLVADQHNRWVSLIQIPTTVLAQADSSIGGKVGVDVGDLKNAVGAFKHPDAVIVDTGWLGTLTDEHYRNGMAETVKHGIIADRGFFDWIVEHREGIAHRQTDESFIAYRNCQIKGAIVRQDPEESGRRRTLNLGHTAGHAVESASRYQLPHGYCVAIGMQVAGRLAIRLGTGYTEEDLHEQADLLVVLGLPIHIPADIDVDHLIDLMRGDKKNTSGKIVFTLPSGIGSMAEYGGAWAIAVEEGMIREALEEVREFKNSH